MLNLFCNLFCTAKRILEVATLAREDVGQSLPLLCEFLLFFSIFSVAFTHKKVDMPNIVLRHDTSCKKCCYLYQRTHNMVNIAG